MNLRDAKISECDADYQSLVRDAIEKGASSIHIEVREGSATIKYRIKPLLKQMQVLSEDHARKMVSTIYRSLTQEDDIEFSEFKLNNWSGYKEIDEVNVKIRFASIPNYPYGFDVVLGLN
jgi:Type II secretory pathway, ATPase PulE/Tfp pilus assembly pathway, ATPase PilB